MLGFCVSDHSEQYLNADQAQSGTRPPSRKYRFEDFVLDTARGALLRAGEQVPLRKQAYEMLVILVKHHGELVSRESLMEAIWSDTVVTENSVTQCLKEIRNAIGDTDLKKIRTVHKRGYIFDVPLDSGESETGSATGMGTSGNRWLLAASAVLIIAAVGWWMLADPPVAKPVTSNELDKPPAQSVAVLPFTNMSPDPDVTYLADGISEEILNQLAQIPDLLVIARTSSFKFRDPEVDIATIGQELNVAHILEGSVRIDGDTTRVTAQLVRTDNQAHLWSQSYERSLDRIFDLQKNIAMDVAQQLHVRLADASDSETQSTHTPNPESYEAYLRGRYLMTRRTRESITSAVEEFGKAVEHDANFSAAHAGLSLATRFLSRTLYGQLPKDEAVARARPHAERALELDPGLAEAHAAMGYVLLDSPTMDQAMTHFRRAVSLNPDYADGLMWLSSLLADRGEYVESMALLEKAVRVDPLSETALWNYARRLRDLGRWKEAEVVLEKFETLAPGKHRNWTIEFDAVHGQWAQGALTALNVKLETTGSRSLDTRIAILLAAMGLDNEALAMNDRHHHIVFELVGMPLGTIESIQRSQIEIVLPDEQRWMLGKSFAAVGDYVRALPLLEENRELMDGRTILPWFGSNKVLALIAARRSMQQETGTETLVAALNDGVSRYRDAGLIYCDLQGCVEFEAAIADYLSGDRESAADRLSKAVTSGYIIPPNMEYLNFLYEDPKLASVFELQSEHRRAEREKFLQAICPDNPFADVWQPAEGFCD